MAKLTTEARNNLPDAKFAYVDEDGNGHFPIQDAAHVRNALARLSQSPFGDKARPKVLAAARRFGITVAGETEKSDGYAFTFDMFKADVTDRDGKMIIRGVASTMGVDRQDEAMSQQAMDSMLKQIKSGKIPLHKEHGRNFDDRIGQVVNGEIDQSGNLVIEAELNQKHPIAKFLYDQIKGGETLGLSVAGKVKGFTQSMRTDLGKVVRTLGDVILSEISVTKHPANLDTIGLTAKSIINDMAKSVPEAAWLASEKGTYMDSEPTETAETGEPTTEPVVETPAVEEQAQEETVAAVTTDEGTDVDGVSSASPEETEPVAKAMEKKMPVADRKALMAKMEAAHKAAMDGMQAAHDNHMKALMDGIGHEEAEPVGPGQTAQDTKKSVNEISDEVLAKAVRSLIADRDEPKGLEKIAKSIQEVIEESQAEDRAIIKGLVEKSKAQDAAIEKLMTMPLQRKGMAIAKGTGTDVSLNGTDATIVTKSAPVEEPKAATTLAESLQSAPYVPVSRA